MLNFGKPDGGIFIILRYIGIFDSFSDTDLNGDGVINVEDVYRIRRGTFLHTYLLARLSRNIDKNQDGLLERPELLNFVNNLFSVLDRNDDDYVGSEDVFKILKDGGVPDDEIAAIE